MNKLSFPKKCLLALLCFVMSIALAYKLSFAKTIELRASTAEKEKKIGWMKEKEKELPALKARIALLEKAYREGDSTSVRDRLTAFISGYADDTHCTVTEIPTSKAYKASQLMVETNVFTIRGGFKELLQMEHAVEKEFGMMAKVVSARFYSVKDMQSKRRNLFLCLTTQSFRQLGSKT